MLNINIDPVIFRIGAGAISWHGVMFFLGAMVLYLGVVRGAQKHGLARIEISRLAVWLLLVGFAASRLVDVLGNLKTYLDHPLRILQLQYGGISVTGAILGDVFVLFWFCKRHQIPFGMLADVFAVAVPPGLFISRIGCLIAGDVAGVPINGWGLVYWHSSSSIPRELLGHPTFLAPVILQILGLILFITLLWLRRKSLRPGILFAIFLVCYGLGRFIVNYWQPDPPVLWGLTYVQWTALSISSIGASYLGSLVATAHTHA